MFNALWPKTRKVAPPEIESAQANGLASEPVLAASAVEQSAPEIEAADEHPMRVSERPQRAAPAAAPLSVLKSGVIDGMAYTLYSDGSIAASLPQGVLRFGSISELREHIENAS